MLIILRILIDGALLWFITVFVSQQHRLYWLEFAFWILMAYFVGAMFNLLGMLSEGIIPILLGAAAASGVLYFALHFRFGVKSFREKNTIILIISPSL